MKKLIALVIALALVLASCAVAFAAVNDKVSVTINGIHAGDTLQLFQIAKTEYNAGTNQLDWTWNGGLKEEDFGFADEGFAFTQNSDGQKAALAAYKALKGTTPVTAVANESGVATASVDPGYYVAFVVGGEDSGYVYQRMLINAVQVVDAANNTYVAHDAITATMKKEPITVLKTEADPVTANANAKTTDGYSQGDEIPFTITTSIPSYPSTSVNATFVITDTPNGLTDEVNTVVVKIDGTETEPADGKFKVEAAGNGFKITFDKAYILANPAASVVVTYKAILNGPVTLSGGTDNTATIEYNPNPDETTTVKPDDTTEQFEYGVVVYKYDDATNQPLPGATFRLLDGEGDNAKVVGEAKVTDENGYISWTGLKQGTYYIEETAAPAGYKLDSTKRAITLSKTAATGDDPTTTPVETYFNRADIPNTKGTTLPETGGIGTTIFYILGGLLVIGAAVILVARKKAQD